MHVVKTKRIRRMRHKKLVLFVCEGNTCRSPMAEIIFNSLAKDALGKEYKGFSAGLCVQPDTSINPLAALALEHLDCKAYSSFKSRQLTPELLESAHRVFCMTDSQRRRLFGYTEVRLLAKGEIEDPYGGTLDDYIECAYTIKSCVESLIRELINEKNNKRITR